MVRVPRCDPVGPPRNTGPDQDSARWPAGLQVLALDAASGSALNRSVPGSGFNKVKAYCVGVARPSPLVRWQASGHRQREGVVCTRQRDHRGRRGPAVAATLPRTFPTGTCSGWCRPRAAPRPLFPLGSRVLQSSRQRDPPGAARPGRSSRRTHSDDPPSVWRSPPLPRVDVDLGSCHELTLTLQSFAEDDGAGWRSSWGRPAR